MRPAGGRIMLRRLMLGMASVWAQADRNALRDSCNLGTHGHRPLKPATLSAIAGAKPDSCRPGPVRHVAILTTSGVSIADSARVRTARARLLTGEILRPFRGRQVPA